MSRFIFNMTLGVAALVGALTLLTTLTPRSGRGGSAIVFHQYHSGVGRSVVYSDPFRDLQVRRAQTMYREIDYTDRPRRPTSDVYVSPRPTEDGVDLFLFQSDGAMMHQITQLSAFPPVQHQWRSMRSNTYPHWSPDGEWIAFLSTDPLAIMDVFIVQPDGSELQRVAHDVGTPTPTRLRWTVLEDAVWRRGELLLALGGIVFGVVWIIRQGVVEAGSSTLSRMVWR